MAPEDVPTLRALSDLYGEEGAREDQLKLLRQILAISRKPKTFAITSSISSHPKPRADEAYAWAAESFLPQRSHARRGIPASHTSQSHRRRPSSRTVSRAAFTRSSSSRSPTRPPRGAREYEFEYETDSETVQLRAAQGVPRRTARSTRRSRAARAARTIPSIAMYTSARTFYVHFPRLEPGDVVELRYRVEDVAPRNEFADYFGEIEYLQIGRADRAAASTC